MFTGLVEEIGTLAQLTRGRSLRVTIRARKVLEDCKAEFAKELLPLKTEAAQCETAQAQLDNAKGQVWAANGKTCDTGSISKGK